MTNIQKITTTAIATLAMAIPSMARDNDHGRYDRGRDRDRRERVYNRGGYRPAPNSGFGFSVGRPVAVPAPAPVYASYTDPQGYDPAYNGNDVYAPYAPPAPQYESAGYAPGPGYVWMGGSWNWAGGRYAWSPGRWSRPPYEGARWTANSWVRGSRGFGLRVGYWHR